MSAARALRGSCHCGRNQYIVQVPANAGRDAQILFDTDVAHRIASATPLSAFLRVPLTWYRSQTFPFFPDETRSTIRRIYTHPAELHTQRQFCGFCGTPISYFTEKPPSEADYIQLTLGSLLTEDLRDLEEMGLVGEDEDEDVDPMDIVPTTPAAVTDLSLIGRDFTHIPWFDSLIQGSRLGNIHTSKGSRQSRDGTMHVEWEITEWTAEEDDDVEADASEAAAAGKRKRVESDQGNGADSPSAR